MEKERIHAILQPFFHSDGFTERQIKKRCSLGEFSELIRDGYIVEIAQDQHGGMYRVTPKGNSLWP